MDWLVFGGFAAAALWRLFPWPPSWPTALAVLALGLIAGTGLWLSLTRRLSRPWGITAFVLGWFWLPWVALVLLLVLGGRRKPAPAPARVRPEPPPALPPRKPAPAPAAKKDLDPESRDLLRQMWTLKLVGEWGAQVQHVHAAFTSEYGEGVIPVLVEGEDGPRGVYVEVGPWTWPIQEECLRWLGLLRTSEHEDLPVEIRSNAEVPETLTFYTGCSLRIAFELEGLLGMRWGGEDFARDNAATLRRLAARHLGTALPEGVAGLTALDELVLEYLRRDRHILPSTVILLGSFVGQVLVERSGGRWVVGDDIDHTRVAVTTPRGELQIDVFGKVLKLFHNGAEDATAMLAVSFDQGA